MPQVLTTSNFPIEQDQRLREKTQPDPQAGQTEDKGLHHACWTQYLLFCLRWLPMSLCEWLNRLVVSVIYVLAKPQRQAVYHNLMALHPEDGPLIAWLRGWHVFHQFALTYLDRLWHMHLGQAVSWTPVGEEHFQALRDEPGGALIFTIHAGNYDMGSTQFADKLNRELHTVRVPERTQSLQKMRCAELTRNLHPLLHIHYNQADSHLGLELCRLLNAGKLVAVQGDRVVMDVSPVLAERAGQQFHLPLGPLVLAEITRVPCYPIFLERTGRLAYSIHIGPAFCSAREQLSQTELAQRWLAVMQPYVARHWDQWFVFEPLVTQLEAKS